MADSFFTWEQKKGERARPSYAWQPKHSKKEGEMGGAVLRWNFSKHK